MMCLGLVKKDLTNKNSITFSLSLVTKFRMGMRCMLCILRRNYNIIQFNKYDRCNRG